MLAAGFEKIDLHEVIWQRAMTKAEFIDMSCSSSKMAAARKATDDRVLDELRALVGRHTDKAGKITVDYVTRIVSGVA